MCTTVLAAIDASFKSDHKQPSHVSRLFLNTWDFLALSFPSQAPMTDLQVRKNNENKTRRKMESKNKHDNESNTDIR